jgi:hypothetical protein
VGPLLEIKAAPGRAKSACHSQAPAHPAARPWSAAADRGCWRCRWRGSAGGIGRCGAQCRPPAYPMDHPVRMRTTQAGISILGRAGRARTEGGRPARSGTTRTLTADQRTYADGELMRSARRGCVCSRHISAARPDTEEQAELARRADADARPGRSGCSCSHSFLPRTRPAFHSGIPYASASAASLTFPDSSHDLRLPHSGCAEMPLWSQTRRVPSSVMGDFVPGWRS